MGYVGNQTTNAYTSLDKQTITGDGGTSYTLDHAVANANEIEVFVNNVRQEPSVAYTVSGTALTMTGNVAASDDFYVVFQGKAVGTVVPPDDSVTTARINDGAVTSAKLDTNIDISGTLDVTSTLTADAGIKLGSGTDALDFYEEGSFTPVYANAGTATFSHQVGLYTRIGRLVFVQIHMDISASGTASGNLIINNLPFTAVSQSEGGSTYGTSGAVHCNGWSTGRDGVQGLIGYGSTELIFYWRNGNGMSNVTHADIGLGNLLCTAIYKVAT